MFMDQQDYYKIKMAVLPKASYRVKVISIKIPTQFFRELERTISASYGNANNP